MRKAFRTRRAAASHGDHRGAGAGRRAGRDASTVATLPRRSPQSLTRRLVLGGAIAAAAGYVMIDPPFDMWPSLEEFSADYRTGKGEHRRVMVAPDVSIELNTQTSAGAATGAERDPDRADLRRSVGRGQAIVVDAAGDAGP